jgi:hypothetical protein
LQIVHPVFLDAISGRGANLLASLEFTDEIGHITGAVHAFFITLTIGGIVAGFQTVAFDA